VGTYKYDFYARHSSKVSTTVQSAHLQHICGRWSFDYLAEPLKFRRECGKKIPILLFSYLWVLCFKSGLGFEPKRPSFMLRTDSAYL